MKPIIKLKISYIEPVYFQGCVEVINHWANEYVPVLCGLGFAFAFLNIFGLIFGCCVLSSVKKSEMSVNYA